MNIVVTYKTTDEYMDFKRFNNMSKTLALLATSELADFKEGGCACEANRFYREAEDARPVSLTCTKIDSSKQWALLRMEQSNGRKVSQWLYIRPAFEKKLLPQRTESHVTRFLQSADGWAWARLNFMSASSRPIFMRQQADGYLKRIEQIDEQIEALRRQQLSLRNKARHRKQAIVNLSKK